MIEGHGIMINVVEAYGRKQLELEGLKLEYANLLGLLGRIKAGEVSATAIEVNLEAQTWRLVPATTDEGQPATAG